jgi:integrase/recombinase XerD
MPSERTDEVTPEVAGFLSHRRALGRAPGTLDNHRRRLEEFRSFLTRRNVPAIQAVTPSTMEAYKAHLFRTVRRRNGKGASVNHAGAVFTTARQYLAYLSRRKVLFLNPAENVVLPRSEARLPRRIPTEGEVERLLAVPRPGSIRGQRARALLEVIYSSGLRRKEIIRLNVPDVDLREGTLRVHQGKGRKDRVVPVGKAARAALERYLAGGRKRQDKRWDTALFLTRDGRRLTPQGLSVVVKLQAERAKVEGVTCYRLRHAFATHMLRGGAEIRRLQEMLGHADLRSTQVYTRISPEELKAAHRRHHPRGKIGPDAPPDMGYNKKVRIVLHGGPYGRDGDDDDVVQRSNGGPGGSPRGFGLIQGDETDGGIGRAQHARETHDDAQVGGVPPLAGEKPPMGERDRA